MQKNGSVEAAVYGATLCSPGYQKISINFVVAITFAVEFVDEDEDEDAQQQHQRRCLELECGAQSYRQVYPNPQSEASRQ
ncbi:Hypothetical predicted protein [Prunus dulcis]|uniref:Uncharacterized protein n=1 Tax=Prunus dulcis TaxID=3755 RepID=A0A5E4FPQ3_PRUDU|nr:Hypothetical predicted protein [Prunus dulcis]